MHEENVDETSKNEFTERAIMSLVMEMAELKETTTRLGVVLTALAVTYGVSIEV
jgi:hypothetical protein